MNIFSYGLNFEEPNCKEFQFEVLNEIKSRQMIELRYRRFVIFEKWSLTFSRFLAATRISNSKIE